MARQKVLDCVEFMQRGMEGRVSGLKEISRIDQDSLEREMNSNIERNLRLKGLDKILAIPLSLALIFNPMANARAYAQQAQTQQGQYEPCNPANPSYCTECRDENARDFAKCGEIDYRNINLMKSDRVIAGVKGEKLSDVYQGKGVFVASIGTVHKDLVAFRKPLEKNITEEKAVQIIETEKQYHNQLRYEVFTADENGENQKRLTYSPSGILCYAPIFTPHGEGVAYREKWLAERYVEKYPNEKFKEVGNAFISDYAAIFARSPFAWSFYLTNLSNGFKERLKVNEEHNIRKERE